MTRSHLALLVLGLLIGGVLGVAGGLYLSLFADMDANPEFYPELASTDGGPAHNGPAHNGPAHNLRVHNDRQALDLPVESRGSDAGAERAPVQATGSSGAVVLKSLPGPRAEGAGTGRLWGKVLDEQGEGVEGVVIRMRPEVDTFEVVEASSVAAGALPLGELADKALARAQAMVDSQSQTLEVTTDASGCFSVEHLELARWDISAHKPGLVIVPSTSYGPPVATGQEVLLQARKSQALAIDVRRADGEPVSSAVIVARPGISGYQGMRTVRWTPESGQIFLEAGRWRLQALAGDVRERPSELYRYDADLVSGMETIQVAPGVDDQVFEMILQEPTVLSGRLLIEDQDLLNARFTVKLAPFLSTAPPSMDRTNSAVRSQSVSAGARFAFQDLEAGRYLVVAAPGSLGTVVHEEVLEIGSGRHEHDVVIPALDRAKFVRLRCSDPAGEPVLASHVRLRVESPGGGSWSGGVTSIPLKDGGQLVELPTDAMEAGGIGSSIASIEMIARHPIYSEVRVSVEPHLRATNVQFLGTADLEITVTGIPAEAHEGLRVFVQTKGGKESAHDGNSLQPDKNGVVRFERVSLGECELQLLQQSGDRPRFRQPVVASSQHIVLSAGSNTLQVAYPSLHDLEVYAPHEKQRYSVSLSRHPHVAGAPYTHLPEAVLGDDQRAVLKGVPAGTYMLRAGASRLEVTVPCGPVTLER